jgi:hypothetical protein
MSTWHRDEPLEEALLLFWDAFPAEGKRGGPARIGVRVRSHEWIDDMRRSADDFLRGGEQPKK